MPIEGTLREFALPDIFQLLFMARKSGELSVVRAPSGARGAVLFKGGAVVDARLDERSPRLAYMLLNAGKITEAELHKADLARSKDPSRSWKAIFQSLGSVAPEDLENYARFQVEEFIYEILDWRDGHFVFKEREIADSERVTLIPVESLLMEGARRADELSALGAPIEGPGTIPRLAERIATETKMLDLEPEEWEVLGQVDGRGDVKTIAWTLGRSEFDVSKIISGMVEKGVLEIGSRREAVHAQQGDDLLDRAEGLIERNELGMASTQIDSVLKAHPQEPRAHYLAARILEKEGDLRAAEQGYENTLSFDPLAHDARQRLGLVRLKLGDLTGAAHIWKSYLRVVSDAVDRKRIERGVEALQELQFLMSELDGREHS